MIRKKKMKGLCKLTTVMLLISACTGCGQTGSYNSSGNYSSTGSQNYDSYAINDVAVVLDSVIDISDDNEHQLEGAYLCVTELEEIKVADIYTAARINGDSLDYFLFNDGWGAFEGGTLQISVNAGGQENLAIEDFFSLSNDEVKVGKINPGEIVEAASMTMYTDAVRSYIENYGTLYMAFEIKESGKQLENIEITIDENNDFKLFIGGGWGGLDYYEQAFCKVDVSSGPQTLPLDLDTDSFFNGWDNWIVIAPTQSCYMTYRAEYTIDGQVYETETYSAEVRVPYYYNLLAVQYLVECSNGMNLQEIRNQLEFYRYDAGLLSEYEDIM